MKRRTLAAALALGALVAAPAAEADDRPCLTEAEAADLSVVLLPPLVTAAATRCQPALPAGAFLIRAAPGLAARYRVAADLAWPRARAAAERIGQNQLGSFLSEDVERAVMEQVVSAAIVTNIRPADCATVSDFAEAAAPLPASNIGRLIALALRIKLASGLPFRICAASEGQ